MKVNYRELKTKNRANSGHTDMDINHKNYKNKLEESTKIKKYLLDKYGTLTDVSKYDFHDKNLFVDYMVKLQGYSEGFIYRTYGAKKQKINWDKVHQIPNFWDNVDFEKLWRGDYN